MADTQQQNQSKFSFLKKSLPWLGTVASIALPQAAPLIAIATKILGGKLNKSIAPDANSLSDALTAALGDPALHAQLLEAEQAYQQAMTQMGYQHETDMETIAEKDRDSARNREIQTKDWYPKLLASVVVTLCLIGEGWYFRYGAPSNAAPELIGRILGTLDSALILVLSYYFGSSAGSDRKTEIIANGNNTAH